MCRMHRCHFLCHLHTRRMYGCVCRSLPPPPPPPPPPPRPSAPPPWPRLTPARAAPVSARVPGAVCGGVLGAAAPVPPAAVPLGPAAAVRMPDTGDGAVHDHGGVAARLLAVWLLYCQLFVVCLMLVWCVFGVCVHVPVLGVGVRRRLRCRRADVPFPPSLHVCVPAVPRRRFSRPPA